jgi:hypothetical protein
MRPRAQSSHGRGFGAQAEVYDEVRPGYPAAALDLAGSDWQGMRVCDLGAGTGILSRELLARGCEVLAVDPDPRGACSQSGTEADRHCRGHRFGSGGLRPRHRRPGLALVRRGGRSRRDRTHPHTGRQAAHPHQPARCAHRVGAAVESHHARRRRLPAALPAAAGCGSETDRPPHRRVHHGTRCRRHRRSRPDPFVLAPSDERTRDRVESNLREYFRDERPVTDAIELPYMCLAYLLERS